VYAYRPEQSATPKNNGSSTNHEEQNVERHPGNAEAIVMSSGWGTKALARWRKTKKPREKRMYIGRRRGYLSF